ncbi:MAG: Holliday junction resolvase RuvX [Solirubrobacterales bacterium]
MRILALDHGSATCGCAICDPTETVVRPIEVIKKPDSPAGQDSLAGLIDREAVELVVVGLPRLASGEEGAQAGAARAFAGRLGARIDAPVKLYDERFTTRLAQSSIAGGAAAAEDSLAAAHLLEEFLELRRRANTAEDE